ncbi:MAG: 50S ribosomal protein L30, partial [Thermoanaerobaculia bacterium]
KAVARPKKTKAAPAPEAAAPRAAGREPRPPAARAAKTSAGTVRIRLVRSGICTPRDQKATLHGLGLRRIRQEVVRSDTPSLRGMLHKVRHLVEVAPAT